MRSIIKQTIMVSIALILIATGAFAGVTRQDGKVALDIQEEGFIITSKSYFTGLMDLTIEKVDDSNYLIHWAWDDLNARTEITNCFEKSGSELTSCAETIKKIKEMDGLRGIHILSGGKEAVVPELLAASGL